LSAAKPIEGRMRSTRQVTNRPTRMESIRGRHCGEGVES
jgi:hypothetical protein